jgi:hypothetical protein
MNLASCKPLPPGVGSVRWAQVESDLFTTHTTPATAANSIVEPSSPAGSRCPASFAGDGPGVGDALSVEGFVSVVVDVLFSSAIELTSSTANIITSMALKKGGGIVEKKRRGGSIRVRQPAAGRGHCLWVMSSASADGGQSVPGRAQRRSVNPMAAQTLNQGRSHRRSVNPMAQGTCSLEEPRSVSALSQVSRHGLPSHHASPPPLGRRARSGMPTRTQRMPRYAR